MLPAHPESTTDLYLSVCSIPLSFFKADRKLNVSVGGDAYITALRKKLKSPSTAAENKQMMSTQNPGRHDAIWNGRPATMTGPSISIYHPIFEKFRSSLASTRPDNVSEHFPQAYSAALASLKYYQTREDRHVNAAAAIGEFLNCVLEETKFNIHGQICKPNMHKRVSGMHVRKKLLLLSLIGEVKNGFGLGGCDPSDQAAKVYMILCSNPDVSCKLPLTVL